MASLAVKLVILSSSGQRAFFCLILFEQNCGNVNQHKCTLKFPTVCMQVGVFASLQTLISHLDLSDFCMQASASLCCYLSLCICAKTQITSKCSVTWSTWWVCKSVVPTCQSASVCFIVRNVETAAVWLRYRKDAFNENLVKRCPCVNLYFFACLHKGFQHYVWLLVALILVFSV